MFKKIYYTTFIVLGCICFVGGFVTELLHFNIESCWIVASTILCFIFAFAPKVISRYDKYKYSKWLNFVIVFSGIYLILLGGFLMTNLIYFAVWGTKLWEGYASVMYPAIIGYCLLECYVDYMRFEKYKNPDDYYD